MKALAVTKKRDSGFEHLLLVSAFTLFSVICCTYMYLLSASVIHVVLSKEIDERMHRINSEIAALEASYMERQHEISKQIIEKNGYVKVAEKVFIDINGSDLVTKR